MEEIVNRVAKSGVITIDLEELYPEGDALLYDIKDNLWQGIALKEKDFRQFVKENDWSIYQDKYVAIHCSVDAIIPTWAFMLLTIALAPYAKKVFYGNLGELQDSLLLEVIENLDIGEYADARVVVKGCSKKNVSVAAYVGLSEKLLPVVKSLMYGEACSSVPLYKQPRK